MHRLLAIALLWFLCCGFGPGWQKPPLGAQLNRSHPLAQGLYIALAMNEQTSGAVFDYVNQNLVSANSLTSVADGLLYTNMNSLLSINDNNQFEGWSKYTLFCIVTKTGSHAGIRARIFDKNGGVVAIAHNDEKFEAWDQDFAFWRDLANYTFDLNKRTSLTFVYSNKTFKSYINGKYIATSLTFTGDPGFGNGMLRIGNQQPADADFWHGILHIWYLYNRDLSLPEISNLHAQPYAMFQRPILSRPYLNYGSGGAPPAAAPTPRRGQAIIIGKAGKHDIIAWAKEGN